MYCCCFLDVICGGSELKELAIFKENYPALCNTITDINELLEYFVKERIITIDQREEIKTCITKSEQVSKLLLNISGPLEASNTYGFYTMLEIMKTHGVNATQDLADHIITRVLVNESNLPSPVKSLTNNSIPDDWTKGLLLCH